MKKQGQSCTDPRGKAGTCSYIFEPQCSNVIRALRILGLTSEVRRYLLGAIQAPCGFETKPKINAISPIAISTMERFFAFLSIVNILIFF